MKQFMQHKPRSNLKRPVPFGRIFGALLCFIIQSPAALPLHAAELWTISGINAWIDELGALDDYVGTKLLALIPEHPPARRYHSRLGTKPQYTGNNRLRGAGSARRLNGEAANFANGTSGYPAISRGMFHNRQVRVLLIAPKTRLRPPAHDGLCVEIYWSPLDRIPNQHILAKGRWDRFIRGCGREWPVYNPQGEGLGRGHEYAGFLEPRLPVMQQQRRRVHGKKTPSFSWRQTSKHAPGIVRTLREWLNDPEVDYVIVGHSQGANIAMYLLRQGYY